MTVCIYSNIVRTVFATFVALNMRFMSLMLLRKCEISLHLASILRLPLAFPTGCIAS